MNVNYFVAAAQTEIAQKKPKRLIIKESVEKKVDNGNYKMTSGKQKKNSHTIVIHAEKDSIFEDQNYKHQPHNKATRQMTVDKQTDDQKDENYKHQFPSGK